MKKNLVTWLLSALFVSWLFLIIGNFFVVQKPFAGVNALAFARVLLDVGAAVWLGVVALGLGSSLVARMWSNSPGVQSALWTPGELGFGETLVLGTGFGFGVLGLLAFALGLLGLFRPLIFYSLTIALTLLVAPQLKELFLRWRQHPPLPTPNLPTTVYCLLIATFTILLALLPPTDWDGLFYHLTGPKIYIEAGGIIGGIDIPHLSFPSLMEMLFAWVMILRGDIAAKLLHTQFAFLLAGLVYLTARDFFGKKAAWSAIVVLLSMPMVSTLAGWAYNDLALAFYQLASVYAVSKWLLVISNACPVSWELETSKLVTSVNIDKSSANHKIQNPKSKIQNPHWLILCGIFAGLAMGLKYTSFITPLTVGLLILWYSLRTTHHAPLAKFHVSRFTSLALRVHVFTNLASFALPALLIAAPWYLKNWVFTGNPVYPFLYGLFGGQFWDGFRAEWYAAAGSGIGWSPRTLLTLPWLLTLGVNDVNYWDGRTGPLLLLFLPLILLFAVPRLKVWFTTDEEAHPVALTPLLIYALAHFAVWTVGVIWSRSLWQSRLLLPGLAALVPLAGWVWAELPHFDRPQFSLSGFVNLAIALILALGVVDAGLLTLKYDPLPYLTGLESRDAYLTRRLGAHYAAMQEINATLPAEAVVVFLWEPRSYYCQRDCRPDSILDEFPHLVYQYEDAAAIARSWREAGITHILIHRAGLNFILKESPARVDADRLASLEANFLTRVASVGGYELYALEPSDE